MQFSLSSLNCKAPAKSLSHTLHFYFPVCSLIISRHTYLPTSAFLMFLNKPFLMFACIDPGWQQIGIQPGGGRTGWKQAVPPLQIQLQHCSEGSSMQSAAPWIQELPLPQGCFSPAAVMCCSFSDSELWGKSLEFPPVLVITWSGLLSLWLQVLYMLSCVRRVLCGRNWSLWVLLCLGVGGKIAALNKRILAADDLVVESSLPLLFLKIVFIFSEGRKRDGNKRGPLPCPHSSAGELSFYWKLFFY